MIPEEPGAAVNRQFVASDAKVIGANFVLPYFLSKIADAPRYLFDTTVPKCLRGIVILDRSIRY